MSEIPAPATELATIHEIFERFNLQEMEKTKFAVETMKSCTLPLSTDDIEILCQFGPHQLDEALSHHTGYKIWAQVGSFRLSKSVLESAIFGLLASIENFTTELNKDIFKRSNENILKKIESEVQKELFSALDAIHSLICISSRLQKSCSLDNYLAQLEAVFEEDCHYQLIRGLRNIIHHRFAIKSNWYLMYNFDGIHISGFEINKTMLLKQSLDEDGISKSDKLTKKQSEAKLKVVNDASIKHLDISELFKEYLIRANNFNDWFAQELNLLNPNFWLDCEKCFSENNKYHERLHWKSMLENWLQWDSPPNPYDHLDRYLSEEQLVEVKQLPTKSKTQIDQIIDCVDVNGACDQALRELVYKWFERVPS
jgi:hypothetical protein